ncbi:hypothetical protein RchiOBHm_Chr5g0065881 [Rosa chinensis]|uniref:Uncharacterized protein n=1 Tax=Rosa chinensis TaxID=74649 RepID=A0A2P6QJ14_ROSCH|nr:hypothetical protein RchiOBHm_Chr5g0065881 [Rosa chinensis]
MEPWRVEVDSSRLSLCVFPCCIGLLDFEIVLQFVFDYQFCRLCLICNFSLYL